MAKQFKLSKQDIERRDQLNKRAASAKSELETGIEEYNAAVRNAREALGVLLSTFNEVVNDAKGFAEDIANEQRGTFDDRSETWQQGERGSAVNDWIEQYEQLDLDELEIDEPSDIEPDIPDVEEKLNELPDEAEV